MKNKQAEQEAARQKLREERKRGRRKAADYTRVEPHLTEKPSILIVCEGENTEPSYFNQFRMLSATIKAIGEGYNTISLVQRTGELSERGNYDQVWCVFDKDDFPPDIFNRAISLAESMGFQVAYSNQAFEYWILLHFEDHQGGGMHRDDYHGKLKKILNKYGVAYDGRKSKLITDPIFRLMEALDEKTGKQRITIAISRAERNYHLHDHTNPALEESSTTVFKLVKELLKYID